MEFLNVDKNDGYAKLRIDSKDDLWYLDDIIAPGDILRAKTMRTMLDGRDKKTTTLSLRVEKTEYQEDRLRVTGEITEGSEDIEMGYHTFNLDLNKEFELWKNFSEEEWNLLNEAEQHESYTVLFCLVEKGSADFFIVEESGIKELSKVDINMPGKMYSDQDSGDDFFKQVKDILQRTDEKVDYIVLGGPGHVKNRVANLLEDTSSKVFIQDTSVTGRTGLNEAFKRGALDNVVKASRISRETQILEDFFDKLRENDDLVAFGEELVDFVEIGAVEKILMLSTVYRDRRELAEKVEQQGGESFIVHEDHEAGERLENFGGLAGILRYNPR